MALPANVNPSSIEPAIENI